MSRPSACVLIIGHEILSGRTQDQNVQYIARGCAQKGILLQEVRMIPDDVATIIGHIRSVQCRYTCVITTGGLGSTHDDVTTEAVAQALDVPLIYREDAWAMMQAHYGLDLNPVYQSLSRFPEGAALIPNTMTGAPGFSLKNIHVLAGVPRIMQVMFDALLPTLPAGEPWYEHTLECQVEEGLMAQELAELQQQHPDVQIGSYPMYDGKRESYKLHLVLKADEPHALKKAIDALSMLIHRYEKTS